MDLSTIIAIDELSRKIDLMAAKMNIDLSPECSHDGKIILHDPSGVMTCQKCGRIISRNGNPD